MALSIFPLLNDHHNHLSPECFHLSNLKPDPLNINLAFLPFFNSRHLPFHFVSMNLTTVSASYKLNHVYTY